MLGGVLFFSTVWWFAGGRKHYDGPRSHTEITEVEAKEEIA
jgi:hypothetical protein